MFAEKIIVEGGLTDMRHILLNVKHSVPEWLIEVEGASNRDYYQVDDQYWLQDSDFDLRLNNTRLLTSRLIWRPELKQELLVSFYLADLSFLVCFLNN